MGCTGLAPIGTPCSTAASNGTITLLTILTEKRRGTPVKCSIFDTSFQQQHKLLRDIEKGKRTGRKGHASSQQVMLIMSAIFETQCFNKIRVFESHETIFDLI